MCVIIYVPKESEISYDEICNAWSTNPDGAGYSIQKDNKVYFKRGFMKLQDYLDEITPLIGKYNLMLHFRISTSKSVNKVQTHPYKKGNVTITEGSTSKPVICMNGVIHQQKEYKGCNDTMSFIADHEEAFSVINQDILNLIEDVTGAKWAVMKPDEVLLSSKFTEQNGRYYSNKNHLWRSVYNYTLGGNRKKCGNERDKISYKHLIKNKSLIKSINKDRTIKEDLEDFVDTWCNNMMCAYCTKCLTTAKTLRDIKITLNENWYYEDYYNDDSLELYNDGFVDYNKNYFIFDE